MDALQLKKLQAPLKEKYTEDPASAVVTLQAKSTVCEGITCNVEIANSGSQIEAGLHPATGGDGLSACSGDMLLESLAACAGVTLKAVATAIGIKLEKATIQAEGDLDFRGTLAVSKDAAVGFNSIRLFFDLKSDADEEQLQSLIKLTERYCVVYQTLAKGISIKISY